MSLTLEYRRAFVTAFWLLVVAVVMASGSAAAYVAGLSYALAWGAGAAVLGVLPGLFWEPWFEYGVWAWNGVSRRVAAGLRAYALRVGYYAIVCPLALAGRSPEFASPPSGASGWVTRHHGAADRAAYAGDPLASACRSLRAFARADGNRWALSLLPLVFLLSLVREEAQESAVPGNTYTLY